LRLSSTIKGDGSNIGMATNKILHLFWGGQGFGGLDYVGGIWGMKKINQGGLDLGRAAA